MRKLAFAYTQYHLLNLINLSQTRLINDDIDLIVFNPEETGNSKILKRICKKKIFKRILIVNNYFIRGNGIKKIRNIIIKMFAVIKNKGIINDFISGYDYDEFYTYGFNMESTVAFNLISRNAKVKYIYYEEGIGSYIWDLSFGHHFYHKLFLSLILTKIPKKPDELLVYFPQMLTFSIPASVTVNSLFQIKNAELINYLWQYNSIPGGFKKFILIEQPNYDNTSQVELFHLFKKYDASVKMHPRSLFNELYSDMEIINNCNGVWEIVCLNDNIEDKVIVSLFSTACFTPKLLFDIEPIVIFLEKISTIKSVDEQIFNRTVNKLRECYRDKDRVIVPASIKELITIIEKL